MTRLLKKPTPDAEEEAAPTLVPKGYEEFTFGDHLRHLHEHPATYRQRLTNAVAALTAYVAAGSSSTLDRGERCPKQYRVNA
jgi:hypothetical protein